jgi:hypothetical protein
MKQPPVNFSIFYHFIATFASLQLFPEWKKLVASVEKKDPVWYTEATMQKEGGLL